MSLGLAAASPAAAAQSLVEEKTFLNVKIGNQPHKLEALIVKPKDATGRLPMFYLANGSVHVRLTDPTGVVRPA